MFNGSTSTGAWQRAWGADVVTGRRDGSGGLALSPRIAKPALSTPKVASSVSPNGLGADAAGHVYVADGGGNERIQEFDTSGTFQRAWGADVVTGGGDRL